MTKIALVGLGYVGLPLAHAFAKVGHEVIGYDINAERIAELTKGHDRTGELSDTDLGSVSMVFTTNPGALEDAEVIILAIPTPVDDRNTPDLTLLESATATVGKHLRNGQIIVYESTVYPGVTEDLCGPILERESGLKRGKDFTLGYSPERINPGDREHTVDRIVKIVAGEDESTTDALCALYGSVVKAGIHRAPSIKVAEMAKAIENAQRDLNIAYINEIAVLCNRLDIATKDVLAAAGTKWNFLKFQPGLVGGHCIGVDPYYLVHMAKSLGVSTHIIAAGRSVNDGMSAHVAESIANALGKNVKGARVLVLGLTFKENVPDTRNSKVLDVIQELTKKGCDVEVHDTSLAINPSIMHEVLAKYGLKQGSLEGGPYDAFAFLVPHSAYFALPLDTLLTSLRQGGIMYDLKTMLDGEEVRKLGKVYLAL